MFHKNKYLEENRKLKGQRKIRVKKKSNETELRKTCSGENRKFK